MFDNGYKDNLERRKILLIRGFFYFNFLTQINKLFFSNMYYTYNTIV